MSRPARVGGEDVQTVDDRQSCCTAAMSFYTAARDGQVDLLKHHLQNGADVHQRFNNDRTALHFA